MNTFFATFRLGFLYLWRRPVSVFALTAFPIIIIFILGNALGGMMEDDFDIDPVPAAYISDMPDTPLYAFLTGEEGASRFISLRRADKAEAEAMLEAGEIVAIIIEEDGVELRYNPDKAASARLAISIIEGYRQIGTAAVEAYARDPQEAMRLMQMNVSVQTSALGTHIPTAIDYYAVTMLVMISLFTGLNGMELFQKNLMSGFAMRLQAAPATRGAVIAGTMTASAVVSYMQILVTFIFSYSVYGVYWGDRLPLTLFTLLLMVLLSQMLSVVLLLIMGHGGAVVGTMQGLAWILTFLSRGFVQLDFGEAEKVFRYIPNKLAQTVIFGAAYGGDERRIMSALAILAAVTAVLCGMSFVMGRRKLA